MLLLVSYLLVFAPLISSKPDGISTAEDEIAIPAELKPENSKLSRRQIPQGSTNPSGRPSLLSALVLHLLRLRSQGVRSGTYTTGYDQQDTSNVDATINTTNQAMFKFQITRPATDVQKVNSAEFHVYKRAIASSPNANSDYILHLIEIRPTGPNRCLGIRKLSMSSSAQGWEVFKISDSFKRWFRNGATNRGLLLTTIVSGIKVHPNTLGYVGFDGPPNQRPFIVVEYQKRSQNDEEKSNDKNDGKVTSNPQAPEKDNDKDDEEGTSSPQAPKKTNNDNDDEEGTSNPQAQEKDNDEDD